MILNQRQKVENAVAYFAQEYRRAYKRWPAQMWIYKLLALLDFRILKATGRPCLGLDYFAMENGPVPQPWDIPIVASRLFADETKKVRVPHTEYGQGCPKCFGRGHNYGIR